MSGAQGGGRPGLQKGSVGEDSPSQPPKARDLVGTPPTAGPGRPVTVVTKRCPSGTHLAPGLRERGRSCGDRGGAESAQQTGDSHIPNPHTLLGLPAPSSQLPSTSIGDPSLPRWRPTQAKGWEGEGGHDPSLLGSTTGRLHFWANL